MNKYPNVFNLMSKGLPSSTWKKLSESDDLMKSLDDQLKKTPKMTVDEVVK